MKLTQEQYEARIAKIMEQEKELGVKIELHPIDKDHLDCIWYSGEVGRITREDGWAVVLEAHGEIRLYGTVNGEEFYFVDKSGGNAYKDLPIADDDTLHKLEEAGAIVYENNNWFEFDVIGPDGSFYDCYGPFDNVVDDNILDFFEDLGDSVNATIDTIRDEFDE